VLGSAAIRIPLFAQQLTPVSPAPEVCRKGQNILLPNPALNLAVLLPITISFDDTLSINLRIDVAASQRCTILTFSIDVPRGF
jgi:hypothetical protein